MGDSSGTSILCADPALLPTPRSEAVFHECSLSTRILRIQYCCYSGWPYLLQTSLTTIGSGRLSGTYFTVIPPRDCPANMRQIALGTVILLAGVLALSWRLNAESDAPGTAASALTPGIGYTVEDSDESDTYSELEEEIPNAPLRREHEDDKLLTATLQQRRKLSQAEEIWGELYDVDSPSSPHISGFQDINEEDDPNADENTSLLRKHPI